MIKKIFDTFTVDAVAEYLNVTKSTVKRWIDLNTIPHIYAIDLSRMMNEEIDYTTYTSKDKDQFFTPASTAQQCYDTCINKIQSLGVNESEYIFIEPSAGDGSFFKILPCTRRIGIDVEPRGENIEKCDFLQWHPQDRQQKYIVIGNPPFGLRGNLALRFINRAYEYADFVAFILPQLFDSDGKGVPRKRVNGYNLIHSEKIEPQFNNPEGDTMKVNVVFQIWAKHFSDPKYDVRDIRSTTMRIYSLSDGGTPSTTRNKKMIGRCHVYLPSTCFGKENMKWYDSFEDLPARKGYGLFFIEDAETLIKKCKEIQWGNIGFLSTNSAYNLRSSIISSQLLG